MNKIPGTGCGTRPMGSQHVTRMLYDINWLLGEISHHSDYSRDVTSTKHNKQNGKTLKCFNIRKIGLNILLLLSNFTFDAFILLYAFILCYFYVTPAELATLLFLQGQMRLCDSIFNLWRRHLTLRLWLFFGATLLNYKTVECWQCDFA
mgnify:CR=1 FL=1